MKKYLFALFIIPVLLLIFSSSSSAQTAPTAITDPASSVSALSATLNGQGNPGGQSATGWFRYSATNPGSCNNTFGQIAPSSGNNDLGSGTSNVSYSEPINGLTPNTTYYFCAIVARPGVTVVFGDIVPFTTTAAAPANKFTIGDKIFVSEGGGADVYDVMPGGSVIGAQPGDATGEVKEGPIWNVNRFMWRIDYDSGFDGWSGENRLEKVAAPSGSITINTPTAGDTWYAGDTNHITWDPGNISGNVQIRRYRAAVYPSTGSDFTAGLLPPGTANDGSYTVSPNILTPAPSSWYYVISSVDDPSIIALGGIFNVLPGTTPGGDPTCNNNGVCELGEDASCTLDNCGGGNPDPGTPPGWMPPKGEGPPGEGVFINSDGLAICTDPNTPGCWPPINVSTVHQIKDGAFTAGFLTSKLGLAVRNNNPLYTLLNGLVLGVNGKIGATEYCDKNGENCIAAGTPPGSSGVSSIIAGDNITLGPSGANGIGNVRISSTGGDGTFDSSGIINCTDSIADKIYWDGAKLVCGDDLQSDNPNSLPTCSTVNPYIKWNGTSWGCVGAPASSWTVSGNQQYSSVSGNVGIGYNVTTDNAPKLTVQSPSGAILGLYNGNSSKFSVLADGNVCIGSAATPANCKTAWPTPTGGGDNLGDQIMRNVGSPAANRLQTNGGLITYDNSAASDYGLQFGTAGDGTFTRDLTVSRSLVVGTNSGAPTTPGSILLFNGGTNSTGKVLTSNSNGVGTWQTPAFDSLPAGLYQSPDFNLANGSGKIGTGNYKFCALSKVMLGSNVNNYCQVVFTGTQWNMEMVSVSGGAKCKAICF